MSYGKINLAVYTISGFTQKTSKPTGIGDLHWKIRTRHGTSPDRLFEHLPWNARMEAEADRLAMHAAPGIRIAVVAFSWGCTYGTVRFARALRKRGMEIESLHLIDPPGPRIWALLRGGTFKVPAKVGRVESFRQVNHGPFGRPLKLRSAETVVVEQWVFGSKDNLARHAGLASTQVRVDDEISHNGMDNKLRIHGVVLDRLESFVRGAAA